MDLRSSLEVGEIISISLSVEILVRWWGGDVKDKATQISKIIKKSKSILEQSISWKFRLKIISLN